MNSFSEFTDRTAILGVAEPRREHFSRRCVGAMESASIGMKRLCRAKIQPTTNECTAVLRALNFIFTVIVVGRRG